MKFCMRMPKIIKKNIQLLVDERKAFAYPNITIPGGLTTVLFLLFSCLEGSGHRFHIQVCAQT